MLRAALVLGSATVLGLFSTSRLLMGYAYGGYSIGFKQALIPSLADWYIWALLMPLILWLARRFPLERRFWMRSLLVHLPASIVISLIKMQVEYAAMQMMQPDPRRVFPILQFHSTILTYWAILGIIYAIDYYLKYREHQLKASRLETQLAEAQLQALKMQLHPHFLFNTLHAISALVHKDVEAADRMIARLSDLLRITLDSVGVQEISLKQELEFLTRYLEIEQTRFQDRLSVDIDIDPDALDARVPNLILQPLVENAIRHGVATRSAAGRIRVRARRDEHVLRLEVSDDGPGLSNGLVKEGVGLANTRARLEQLYGSAHRLDFTNAEGGGLTVDLAIPFRAHGDFGQEVIR
jgi:two-component system, LytTR family, sensor kinase